MGEPVGWVMLFMFVGFFLYLVWFAFISLYRFVTREAENPNALPLQMSRQYKLPKNVATRSYNPDDYWNDAGDGSGVNYVQMPDGSVRID